MEELIIKMVLCLLVALALGFIFGWLIKRAFSNEKHAAIVDDLEVNLAQSRETIKRHADESTLIKEQFVNTQDALERSTLKITECEEKLLGHQTKIMALQGELTSKETHINDITHASSLLSAKLGDSHNEHENLRKKAQQKDEEIARVKEHHTLLQAQVSKLTQEKNTKIQELDKLSHMIAGYKTNEKKLIDAKKAQEGKVTELTATLNEKNIASIELSSKMKEIDDLRIKISNYKNNESKLHEEKKMHEDKLSELTSALNSKDIASTELTTRMKEIDTLNQKNSELSSQLNQAKINQQKAEEKTLTYKNTLKDFEAKVHKVGQQETEPKKGEGFFDKLAHSKEGIADSLTATHKVQSKSEGFDFMKFAKKTLDKITETGDDINAKADKVIQDYKDRK